MHRDLIKKHKLVGMTESEVLALLGADCRCSYFQEYELVYWMGPEQESLFQIDSVWLAIDVGLDGRVSKYSVVTD